MTDRELLELAAKAVGLKVIYTEPSLITGTVFQCFIDNDHQINWNPLLDDGDALRLAVKIRTILDLRGESATATWPHPTITDGYIDESEDFGQDDYAATRRAIVRAAAEIGKTFVD